MPYKFSSLQFTEMPKKGLTSSEWRECLPINMQMAVLNLDVTNSEHRLGQRVGNY